MTHLLCAEGQVGNQHASSSVTHRCAVGPIEQEPIFDHDTIFIDEDGDLPQILEVRDALASRSSLAPCRIGLVELSIAINVRIQVIRDTVSIQIITCQPIPKGSMIRFVQEGCTVAADMDESIPGC